MGSIFSGTINSPHKDFYVYITDDEIMRYLGLSTYTANTLETYFSSGTADLVEYFGDYQSSKFRLIKDQLLGKSTNVEDLSILAFDQSIGKYVLKQGSDIYSPTASDIVTFCETYDDVQIRGKTSAANVDVTLQQVNAIKNSASGCITFSPKITIYQKDLTPKIKIFFQEYDKRKNDRVIASVGDQLTVEIPTSSTGRKFRINPNPANIGAYGDILQGGIKNPQNTVAAPTRRVYNEALGSFESGTQQIIARLLTDIDAAEIPQITNIASIIDDLKVDAFYNPTSPTNMTKFKDGIALPISADRGNPNLCGPNIICPTSNQKEKIKVTNRAPRAFKAGDVVLCSLIGSEWIVQGFDMAPTVKSVSSKFGPWTFSKFIANSDAFFKDQRFFESAGTQYAGQITPDKYEVTTRFKYYASLLNVNGGDNDNLGTIDQTPNIIALKTMNDFKKICALNIYIETDPNVAILYSPTIDIKYRDISPNYRYLHSTSFDQLGHHMGGTNALGTLLKRTNKFVKPDNTEIPEDESATELGGFWGVSFPDGYLTSEVAKFFETKDSKYIRAYNPAGFITAAENQKPSDILSLDPDKNLQTDKKNLIFSDPTDRNFYQLPADVATNSHKQPIENYDALFHTVGNLVSAYAGYISNSGTRFSWLCASGNIFDPIYGFTPVQSNRIVFNPLSAEVATFYDPNVLAYANNFTDDILTVFDPSKHDAIKAKKSLFNPMLLRESYSDLTDISWGNKVRTSGPAPAGGPTVFPDVNGSERSNLVGILTAKNKFSISSGGSLKFKTTHYIGHPTRITNTGGQFDLSLIFSSFGAIGVGNSNEARKYSRPQWGSTTDRYDSFGTTALHVRVFDQWPDDQTFYDPRYFGVLHFNPSYFGSPVTSKNIDSNVKIPTNWTPANGLPAKYPRVVDQFETNVDFRIPTYGHPTDTTIDNTIVPIDTIVDSGGVGGKLLRAESDWRINPVRRGQLLTKGGFRYLKRVIGINSIQLVGSGLNYKQDEIFTIGINSKIKITDIDASGAIKALTVLDRGYDYFPSNFKTQNSYADPTGKGGVVKVLDGIVYERVFLDACPQERTDGPQRITKSSNGGLDGIIIGDSITDIAITNNDTGQYDGFYYFHNDVITTFTTQQTFTRDAAQYVLLEVSAG